MFPSLKRFFLPDTSLAERYAELVARSRTPALFERCGIPDTLDGRFESIVMHLALAFTQRPSVAVRRGLMEAFVEDMDRSLREIGVSDTGVGKRVKKMAAGLYGRLQAYEKANDAASLKDIFLRNVYSTRVTPPTEDEVQALVAYYESVRTSHK